MHSILEVNKDTDKTKVFGFYYAGGNVNAFLPWVKKESSIAFIPVELPGHGRRRKEPLPTDIKTVALEAARAIADLVEDEEFAIWGHSMGAAVAFEAAAYLEKYYGLQPVVLIVSARQAPGSDFKGLYHCNQGKDALVDDLKRLGMMPDALLEAKDFMDYAIPIIYNDYLINEEYECGKDKLNIPIVANYGQGDVEATRDVLLEWQKVTEAGFEIKKFSGDHFYIFEPDTGYFRNLELTVQQFLHSA